MIELSNVTKKYQDVTALKMLIYKFRWDSSGIARPIRLWKINSN